MISGCFYGVGTFLSLTNSSSSKSSSSSLCTVSPPDGAGAYPPSFFLGIFAWLIASFILLSIILYAARSSCAFACCIASYMIFACSFCNMACNSSLYLTLLASCSILCYLSYSSSFSSLFNSFCWLYLSYSIIIGVWSSFFSASLISSDTIG